MSTVERDSSILAVSKKSRHSERRRASTYSLAQQPSKVGMFSGFESKGLETNYNKSMFAMLFLFSNTLLKFFDGGKQLTDSPVLHIANYIFTALRKMQLVYL